MSGLTPKQEAFAKAYVETGNASEAYRRSYNAENTKPEVVAVKACELLKHGKVSVRVEELQKEAQERHEVSVDSLSAMLTKAYSVAEQEKQTSAMVAAVMGMGKLHGLIVDKKENVTPARDPRAIDARLYQLTQSGREGRASGATGGEGEVARPEQAAPTVPGHGTA